MQAKWETFVFLKSLVKRNKAWPQTVAEFSNLGNVPSVSLNSLKDVTSSIGSNHSRQHRLISCACASAWHHKHSCQMSQTLFFSFCIIWSAQLHYRHKFNTLRTAAGWDIFEWLPWIQRKLSVLSVRRNNLKKSAGNAIVHHGVCTSCGPWRQPEKHSDTNGTDKERQCPLGWSRFPGLNMLNCLLGISIQWESTKGPDFIAPGKVKRLPSWLIHMTLEAAYNLLPWRDALENPASVWPPPPATPPPFPGVIGTHKNPPPCPPKKIRRQGLANSTRLSRWYTRGKIADRQSLGESDVWAHPWGQGGDCVHPAGVKTTRLSCGQRVGGGGFWRISASGFRKVALWRDSGQT